LTNGRFLSFQHCGFSMLLRGGLNSYETRAKDAEFDQIEKWLASDKEYLLAVKNDDFMKRTQLYNAFQEQARELILDSIIFV